ncbi:glycosyltransferase family 2 protein [Flavobacterium capsici]|uniref:Glycosyltransferase family A protein n=1 Tax=Flavobacterium capsici TaxID=3075618 RepID=A0AA96F4Z2_9FLAO|nr:MULTISPECIES: glycosyltransferase family A protein [unclassified Flavobacterium]WNM20251.1 glycosyltransferase family A protein [Flavobacterium sp. PMR2A8]WNM21641.1 glycosyltransferase family A protein [Flavobacterium sp. PMTSA4]
MIELNNKVSIVIPCYNQAEYLDECLQSVYNQTLLNWECIIVNDGSTDNTKDIANEWVKKDSRFHYFEKKNGGLSDARNSGISIATGEFILPLDADDTISNEYLELAVNEFQLDNTLKVVYCKANKFGSENCIWELPDFSLSNLSKNNMIFCSAMYKKSDWKLTGGYDVNMIYGWEDWEFWIALLKNGGNVKRLDHIGFNYRVKNISMVKELNSNQKEEMLQYMSYKHTDFYISQFGSFKKLNDEFENSKNEFKRKLQSEKFVIDLFLKTFFGFTIFGKYKKQK